MITVYRYRVKSMNGLLNKQARAVNYVFNYCNDTQKYALKWRKCWPSHFDLVKLTAGTSKDLGLHSDTINAVCQQYTQSRSQFKRPYLRYRGRKSLAWVPLKGRMLTEMPNGFHLHGRLFKVFKSRHLPDGSVIRDGTNFSRDTRGNWFLNVVVEHAAMPMRPLNQAVGIDLGLKDFATLSNGEKFSHGREYRALEEKLGKVQRARKKRQARNIHAKISNRRADFQHKLSHSIVNRFEIIAVGNVNAKALAKTSFAKSVNDASWSSFRKMLAYKAVKHGVSYEEVSERFSTQTCSHCGCLPEARPKGIAGLGIRTFECSDCGSLLDRDVNAACNILKMFGLGHKPLAVGIPTL